MIDKKIFRLPQSAEVPNHLSKPMSRFEVSFIEPIHRAWASLKKACNWLIQAIIVLLLTAGLALFYFSYQAYNGKVTPFQNIELIGLENNTQELAGTIEGLQDLVVSLKMRLDKLEKKIK